MSRLVNSFLLTEALHSLRRSRFMALIAIGSMTISLLAQGAYFLAMRNASHLLEGLEDRVEMVAYFKDNLDADQVKAAAGVLAALPGCRSVEIVSPEEAARALSTDPEIKKFLDVLEKNPLPVTARLKLDSKDPAFLRAFAEKVQGVEGVQDVNWGQEALERLLHILQVLRLLMWVAGLVLSVAALLIVGNVVRLTVFARREEVSIMKLVGAGNFFVRAPFLLEGCLEGLAGGFLAAAILQGLGRFIHYQVMTELHMDLDPFLPYGVTFLFAVKLAGVGAAMGFVASLLSVGRYLKT
jgi:cell division transport system permease protein